MEITDNRKPKTKLFKDVEVGETFISFDTLYLKIRSVHTHGHLFANAIVLTNYTTSCFDENHNVIPVSSELIIKD
jgi:hypothetical protein